MLHYNSVGTHFLPYSAQRRREITKFEGFNDNVSIEMQISHSTIPLAPIFFLGYFAHIERRERDGIFVKDLKRR